MCSLETFRSIICRNAYAEDKLFLSPNEPGAPIISEWHNISESELNHLVISIKNNV